MYRFAFVLGSVFLAVTQAHAELIINGQAANTTSTTSASLPISTTTFSPQNNFQQCIANLRSQAINSGVSAASYTITTNTPYVLNLTTGNANTSNSTYVKNAAGLQIPTVYTTTKTSGSAGPGTPTWGNNNYNGLSADVFSVAAKTVSAVSATQAAGVYKDTYKIRVYY